MHWTNNKRKALREALQQAYPCISDLTIFAYEELGKNLSELDGDNLKAIAFSLLNWADSQGRLDALYAAFKTENPQHPVLQQVEQKSFFPQSSNMTQTDWDELFQCFLRDDIADLQRAFRQGFKQALKIEFRHAQPQHTPFTELNQVRELLESYDADATGPLLAVRFVEFAILEFQRSSDGDARDLTALQEWRNRIAQRFSVPDPISKSINTISRHAYLLVALEESGPNVNVYSELRITGRETPIRFGEQSTNCSFKNVAQSISKWIHQAENVLMDDDYDDTEVMLEIFLPWQYLTEDIANSWRLTDKDKKETPLGTHRRFLVRSSDRIRDRQIQKQLKQTWAKLQSDVEAGKPSGRFHRQPDCPDGRGTLRSILKDNDATGLMLLAQLPTDLGKRENLFKCIIKGHLD
jgi:hypothetical protein